MSTPTQSLTSQTRGGNHEAYEARTLAGEHARLMRDVARRAAPVLALLGAHAWPHAELGTLTTFLRTAVLRQVSDEEVRLYPHDASAPPFAELSADHVRLHALTAQLEATYADPCPPPQLHALVDELLATLRRHLTEEQDVFAALAAADGKVPSVADLAVADQVWLPADDTLIFIDVDNLPADQAHELCIERLLRLRPGQTAELRAHAEQLLRPVCRWLHEFDSARFGLARAVAGDDHLLRVTCRPAGEQD